MSTSYIKSLELMRQNLDEERNVVRDFITEDLALYESNSARRAIYRGDYLEQVLLILKDSVISRAMDMSCTL